MSFADLKKKRNQNLAALIEKASQPVYGGGSSEEGFWMPKMDKAGQAYAEIRFLPAAEGDDYCWAQYFSYKFQGPTGLWYRELSPTTIGLDDPVYEFTSALYATKNKADEETARKYKRKLNYVSNVLVLKDPANPENEGKVFRWRYGAKVFKKILDAMKPEFQDDKPFNPFDFWEGADFKVKIFKDGDWPSYDKCAFAPQSALYEGDEAKLEAVYRQIKPLALLTAPERFKSYEELAAKFNKVMNVASSKSAILTKPDAVASASPGRSLEDLENEFEDEEEAAELAPSRSAAPADASDAKAAALAFFKRASEAST